MTNVLCLLVLLAVGAGRADDWTATWGGNKGEFIRSTTESRPVLAGRGGPDVLWSDNPLAQMSGGDGFDVLLAPNGAKRMTLDAHGGIAGAGGSSGAVFQLGRGFSIAIGSPGPDVVHLWGGVNIVLLGGSDDVVQVHRPSVAWVWGAQGSDTVCADEGVHLGGVFADVEGHHVCVSSPRTPDARRTLMGVVRAHRVVGVENGVVLEDPTRRGDGHVQEFALEVWAVVDGSDPGVRAIATEAGGTFHGPGYMVKSSARYGNRIPELDVPKLFVLEPKGRHDFWRYTRSWQGPDHGTPLVPGPGLVSPL